MRKFTLAGILGLALVLSMASFATAQVSKDELKSITTPGKVETSIGTLNFMDGAPLPETVQKVYGYLDTMRVRKLGARQIILHSLPLS